LPIATMTDALALLYAPLGQPGSGRVRYGAAMALWRDGLMSAEVLEVYRAAAAHDGRDPLKLLASLGLPLPPPPPAETPPGRLYAAARDYLLGLDHPGAADVRAGLPLDPGAERKLTPAANPVAARWLAAALDAVKPTEPALARAIGEAADQLCWVTYDAYPRAEIGEAFATGHAFAALRGGEAPYAADDFELGLFLVAPGTLYRDRQHAAPELYAPLTGPHGWRFGTGRPLIVKPAHEPVWNPPQQPHLTLTGRVPFLGFYVWTRDVDLAAQVIPADDWTELEAVHIP
jgi:hypothetical protein